MQAETLTYTREEYLELDEHTRDPKKYEFDGQHVYAMAGAQIEHSRIAGNIVRELGNQLIPEGCDVLQSDQRVRIQRKGLIKYTYPDVVALCDEPELSENENPPSLLNSALVVEVTSESTAPRDVGWKLDAYLALETLQEYWVAATDEARLVQYVRAEYDWRLRIASDLDESVESAAFDAAIPLADIYRRVF